MPKNSSPAAPTATLVRIQLELPDDIIDAYERQSTSSRPAETLIAERLRACSTHNAQRGIYLNDTQRAEVERLLGGRMLNDGEALVHTLRTAYSVQIGGAEVVLPEQMYLFIQSRAQENHQSMRDMIADICTRALETFVYGG